MYPSQKWKIVNWHTGPTSGKRLKRYSFLVLYNKLYTKFHYGSSKSTVMSMFYLLGGCATAAKTSCRSSVWHPAWQRGKAALPMCLVQGLAALPELAGGGGAAVASAPPLSGRLNFSVRVLLATENEVVSWRPFSSGTMLCTQINLDNEFKNFRNTIRK